MEAHMHIFTNPDPLLSAMLTFQQLLSSAVHTAVDHPDDAH